MTQCDKLPASAIFHCPFVNKGEAFTKEERAKYGLSGLLPTAVSTVDQQVERMREMLNRFEKPIDKALLLDSIRNDKRRSVLPAADALHRRIHAGCLHPDGRRILPAFQPYLPLPARSFCFARTPRPRARSD